MIRVMLVDDSPIVLHILQRLLSRSPEIQVVGTAADGRKALELIPNHLMTLPEWQAAGENINR
jgi:two-component system chemotaxis response regulator CheB